MPCSGKSSSPEPVDEAVDPQLLGLSYNPNASPFQPRAKLILIYSILLYFFSVLRLTTSPFLRHLNFLQITDPDPAKMSLKNGKLPSLLTTCGGGSVDLFGSRN